MARSILSNQFIQRILAKIYHRLYMADYRVQEQILKTKYQVHPSVVWHPTAALHGDGKIVIEEGTYLGANVLIDSNPHNAKIEIGKYCAIAPNVHIRTISYKTDIHFYDARSSNERKSADIKIGDYVWLGTNVFVCGGVEIGENCVVGANSVVTRSLPPHSICAGLPACVIKMKPEEARTPSTELHHEE